MTQPISITELTRYIKSVIEHEFSFVYITGEISNFKNHTSGHFYFTLKDEKSQISANMWSSRNKDLLFNPENGMKVLVKGRITLYETRGSYQIDVYEMQPAGLGELQFAFEKLKQKLFAEGLFDEDIKKKIPDYPERVGIITSETGAALQDFLRLTQKRYPIVKLFLFEANVQGRGSAESVVRAIRNANVKEYFIDVLVIARGGGSVEDLWTFNEEKVAREIFKSRIPVVSAVGHEIDFTICDFVSDLRAPTPSAAAEMIFPDINELEKRITEYSADLKSIIDSKLSKLKKVLDSSSSNYYFRRISDVINEYKFRLDEYDRKIEGEVSRKFVNVKNILNSNEKLLNSLSRIRFSKEVSQLSQRIRKSSAVR
ncbi:MAG: exodeoxyribonuclease VII large subunit [Ignavibacteria bacterium]|nr:exodeoxyribonuclease VII large subunit [Ignavibacteria bacterium]